MVARNRSVGLPDPELRRHTFENDLGYNSKQIAMAKRYVQHWEEFKKDSTGLLLWGNMGTGKSFLAGCIANALVDKGVPVIMTNFARLLNKLTDMYAGDRNAYIDSFKRYELMIIDDLGIERNSEFAREQVFSVIDSRYRSQLPMIVTTNLTVDELLDPADLAPTRTTRKLLQHIFISGNFGRFDANGRDRKERPYLVRKWRSFTFQSKRLMKLFCLFPGYSASYMWNWLSGAVVRVVTGTDR